MTGCGAGMRRSRFWLSLSLTGSRHSGTVRRTGPGNSGFSGARARTVVRCFASPRNDAYAAALFRRLRVVRDRRARAHQVAIAIDIVDASDRAPVLVGARGAGRKAALGAAVGAGPVVVGDVVHGVRCMTQRRGVDFPAAGFDLGDLAPDRDHGVAEPVEFGLG